MILLGTMCILLLYYMCMLVEVVVKVVVDYRLICVWCIYINIIHV